MGRFDGAGWMVLQPRFANSGDIAPTLPPDAPKGDETPSRKSGRTRGEDGQPLVATVSGRGATAGSQESGQLARSSKPVVTWPGSFENLQITSI